MRGRGWKWAPGCFWRGCWRTASRTVIPVTIHQYGHINKNRFILVINSPKVLIFKFILVRRGIPYRLLFFVFSGMGSRGSRKVVCAQLRHMNMLIAANATHKSMNTPHVAQTCPRAEVIFMAYPCWGEQRPSALDDTGFFVFCVFDGIPRGRPTFEPKTLTLHADPCCCHAKTWARTTVAEACPRRPSSWMGYPCCREPCTLAF